MRERARTGPAQVSAELASSTGRLYVSASLTPYDVESLYDQLAGRAIERDEDVRVVVDLAGSPRDTPELRNLARSMKRLERRGVVINMHAARRKLTPSG